MEMRDPEPAEEKATARNSAVEQPLLSVRGLRKLYKEESPKLFTPARHVHAVDGIDFDILPGETLGLVGESGCGKSTTGRLIAGIEEPTGGTVLYRGKDLYHMKQDEKKKIRTQIQMIFQDSYASLNPRKRIYDILSAPMLFHGISDRDHVVGRVDELLEMVGLPENAKRRYPNEFSGGQRQRIAIAKALSLNPSLIICDEPVSALDMSIQAQILNLMKDLQDDLGVSYLFIAHGLGAVHYISHRIAVMYLGKIVEAGPGREVFSHPAHPYTKALISAVPVADPSKPNDPDAVPSGEVPSAVDLPRGCRFASRCPFAQEKCRQSEPVLKEISSHPVQKLVQGKDLQQNDGSVPGRDSSQSGGSGTGDRISGHMAACFYAAGEL